MKKLLFGLALVAAIGVSARDANAQATADATATLTIGSVLYIDITNGSITFPNPGATEFQAGYVGANETSTLDFGGNVAHDVTIKADAGQFTPLVAGYNKSAGDLEYSLDAGATFAAITTGEVDIVTGNPAGTGSQDVNYRVALDEVNDVPGTYQLDFTYTIWPN